MADKSAILTGVAAVLFAAGVALLFVALYREGSATIVWVAAVLFFGTVACWFAAARFKAREPA